MNLLELVKEYLLSNGESSEAVDDTVELLTGYANGTIDPGEIYIVDDLLDDVIDRYPEMGLRESVDDFRDAGLRSLMDGGNPKSPHARRARKILNPTAEQQGGKFLEGTGLATGEVQRENRGTSLTAHDRAMQRRHEDKLSGKHLTVEQESELYEWLFKQGSGANVLVSELEGRLTPEGNKGRSVIDNIADGRVATAESFTEDERQHARDVQARTVYENTSKSKRVYHDPPPAEVKLKGLARVISQPQQLGKVRGEPVKTGMVLLNALREEVEASDRAIDELAQLREEVEEFRKKYPNLEPSDRIRSDFKETAGNALHRKLKRIEELEEISKNPFARAAERTLPGMTDAGRKAALAGVKELAESIPDKDGKTRELVQLYRKGKVTPTAEHAARQIIENAARLEVPDVPLKDMPDPTQLTSEQLFESVDSRKRKPLLSIAQEAAYSKAPQTYNTSPDKPTTDPRQRLTREQMLEYRKEPLARIGLGAFAPSKGQPRGRGVLLPGSTVDLPSISLLQKATEMPKELQSKLRGTGGPQSILEKAKLASPLYSEFVPNTPGEMFTAHTGLAGSGYPTMTQNVQTPGSLVAEELVDPVHPEKIRGRKAVGEYMPEGNKIFTKAGIHKGFQKELAIPGVGLGGADPVGTFSASSGVPAGDTFVTQAGSPGPYGQFSSGGDDVAKFKRIKGAGGKPGGVPKMLTGGEQSRTFGSGYLTQGSTNPIPNPQSPLGQPNQGAFWLGGGKPPGGGSPHPNTGGGSPPPGGQPPPNPSGGPTSSKSSAPKYGGFSLRDQLTGPQKRTASNTLMGKVSESMRSGWLGKAGKVGGGVLGGLFAISMLKDLFGGGDESQMNADAQSQAVLANMQQAFLAAANEGGLMPTMAQQYGNLANTALEGRLAAILQNPTVPLADINPGAASALGAAGGPRQRSTNPMLSRLMSGEINLNPEEQGLRDPTKGFLSAFMGANAAMATPNPQMMGPQMMPQQQQAPQPGLSDLIAGGLRRTGLPGYVISPIDSAGAAVSDTARGIVEQDVQELQNELAGMTPGSEDYMRKVQALQRAGYSPSAIRTVMGGM